MIFCSKSKVTFVFLCPSRKVSHLVNIQAKMTSFADLWLIWKRGLNCATTANGADGQLCRLPRCHSPPWLDLQEASPNGLSFRASYGDYLDCSGVGCPVKRRTFHKTRHIGFWEICSHKINSFSLAFAFPENLLETKAKHQKICWGKDLVASQHVWLTSLIDHCSWLTRSNWDMCAKMVEKSKYQ